MRRFGQLPLRARAGGVLAVGLWLAITGCGRQLPTNRHEVLVGTVQSLRPEIGQMTVHVSTPRLDVSKASDVPCLLGGDAEIYVNDKFSTLGAIQVGDAVELIGYRHADPRTDACVVALARIARSEALPPAPELTPSTTGPGE